MMIVMEISKLAGGFHVADLYPSIKILQLVSGLRQKLEKVHEEADRILGNILSDHKVKKKMTMMKKKHSDDGEEDDYDHKEDSVDVLLKFQVGDDQLDHPLTDSNIKAVLLVGT